MKMRIGFVLVALLMAVASTQATFLWVDNAYDSTSDDDWFTITSWHDTVNGGVATSLPGATDLAIIDESVGFGSMASMPTISADAGTLSIVRLGQNYAGTSSLTIVSGGSLSAAGGSVRLGHTVDSLGILNMTGGYMVANVLDVGFNSISESAGGSGVVNLSGDAILHAGTFGVGQMFPDYAFGTSQDGTGVVNMAGDALFMVNGDQTGTDWEGLGYIVASEVGKNIQASFNGGSTEFTVIPEPATFGLMSLLGGGMLWVRRRFRS